MENAKQFVMYVMAALLMVWALSGQAQVQSWQLAGESGVQVEILAIGMGNRSAATSPKILYIPNPAEVDSILVQVVAKVPPEVIPPEEVYIATPAEKIHLDTPTFITQGYGYHYEAMLKPASFIKVYVEGDNNPGYFAARALVAYVFRKNADARSSIGKLVHQGIWWEAGDRPDTYSEAFTIPAATGPRDVNITYVITEKESGSRLAILRAEAGAQFVEQTFDDPNCGDEVLVETLILKAVPGDVTQVKATVSSPDDRGDSIYWSGVNITARGEMDLGDAPEPGFPTLLSHDGARHNYRPGYYLGAKFDAESDGLPEANANGDDFNGIDDEDGVEWKSQLVQGHAAQLEVTATAPGFLSAWIDLDGDGSWNQAGEQFLVDVALDSGVNPLSFTVPHTGLPQVQSVCRFRFSSVTGLKAGGSAPDGEVEDYAVPVFTAVELSSFIAASAENVVILQWQTQSESENLGFHVYRSDSEQGFYAQINAELIPGAGSSSSVHEYRYVDRNVETGQIYYYQIVDISTSGLKQWHGPVKAELVKPKTNSLEQNTPNPFNAQTRISYSIKQPGDVKLSIFNLQGQLVRTLVSNRLVPGAYSVIWDGRDDDGKDLPSGTYAYILKMPDSELSQRMTLIK